MFTIVVTVFSFAAKIQNVAAQISHLFFIIPDSASSVFLESGIIAAFSSAGTTVIPHLCVIPPNKHCISMHARTHTHKHTHVTIQQIPSNLPSPSP